MDISVFESRTKGERRKSLGRKSKKNWPWPKKAAWNSNYKYHWWSIGSINRSSSGYKRNFNTIHQEDLYE